MVKIDIYYMREAIKEAKKALEVEEVPVGAIVVYQNRVIGRAYNQVEVLKDATAHAEMIAITQASAALGDWRLNECTLYVTKEPCPMCAGAIVLARVERLVFGAYELQPGTSGSLQNIVSDKRYGSVLEVFGGIEEEACRQLLQSFFKKCRGEKNQTIDNTGWVK